MIFAGVLAGGLGSRMKQQTLPKQFIEIGDTPIIVRSLRPFFKIKRNIYIYISVHPDWMPYTKDLLRDYFLSEELSRIEFVPAGKERLNSVINIVDEIVADYGINEQDIIVFHDAVRPFVTTQMIEDCISASLEDGAALTVVPTTDTIFTSNDGKWIDGTMNRNILCNGQTPAGYNIKLLYEILNKATVNDKKITGTAQLLFDEGYRLRAVSGHTSNLKITTDIDLDIANRIIDAGKRSGRIEVLDCTLRDGGIVVNFDFGSSIVQEIKNCLEASGAEYIECGYIDCHKGTRDGRTCFDNEMTARNVIFSNGKKQGVTYLAMIDHGTFECSKLSDVADAFGIDGIRYAFHKENVREAIKECKIILDKGYELFIQPMVTTRYDDIEFRELIETCNKELERARAFYIVDSFGQLDPFRLQKRINLADEYVLPSMHIGFHAHNNRQMANSNAISLLQNPLRHDLILDSCILGMGKGAGNLCTELIEAELIRKGNSYDVSALYKCISEYFSNQMKKTPWGYNFEYYLASIFGCTTSYINIFTSSKRVTIGRLIELLKNMPEEKRAACDRTFAKEYLLEKM